MNLHRITRATSDSNSLKMQRSQAEQPGKRLRGLWLPTVASALSIASVWSITGGLASCDSTAKFTLPDRKFYAIEAVTAFPAAIDAQGKVIGRVCGAPLLDTNGQPPVGDADGQPVVEPAPADANGFEVTANFMSSSLVKPACASDSDNSIKEGELVNLTRVQTTTPATVTVGNFEFDARCVASQTDLSGCTDAAVPLQASSVVYKNIVNRCDPGNVQGTLVNVALVMDNSGSMKGNVDKNTLKEDAEGYYQPSTPPLTNVASDWSGLRFNASTSFIDSLNANDRIVGYLFDENGPSIASSDSYVCDGSGNPSFDGAACRPDNPSSCPAPGTCDQDPTQTNDSYKIALADAECLAFGSNSGKRLDLENGIDLKRNTATGRASLWKTIDNAFSFLAGGGANCPDGSFGALNGMHIVVVTDGPDTCVDSDDFSYTSLKDPTSGKCRTKCATADATWKALVLRMAKARYPVHVHFIQFQAPGYKDPDPRMMEMACRTDGTYQFINSENFNKSASSGFSDALARAVNRVRNGLSGTWRVGYKWTSIPTESEFPKGAIRAVDGDFVFADSKFDSLDPAVHELDVNSWRFTINGEEDRRVLMRMPCASDADCGGSGDNCSANHCADGGVCISVPAPNGEPCGTNGTCRNGACTAGQTCTAAIAP